MRPNMLNGTSTASANHLLIAERTCGRPRSSLHIWRYVGALLLCFIACSLSYLWGAFNQAAFEARRWEAVRHEMLTPPELGMRPRTRVIPELGIRVGWIEWRNGPIRQVWLEDLR